MKAERKNAESDLFVDVFFTNIIKGDTPYIGVNDHWWISGKDTGCVAVGVDGVTPSIGTNNHWWIGGRDTGYVAVGVNGDTPYVGDNGNWWTGGTDNGVAANGIPSGIIVMWSGLIIHIPKGWALCDGGGVLSNGSLIPDLKGRFIVGFDSRNPGVCDPDYNNIGKYGGEKKVVLSELNIPPHRHIYTDDLYAESIFNGFPSPADAGNVQRSSANDRGTGQKYYTSETGGGSPHENRPPYYVLAYIIKL